MSKSKQSENHHWWPVTLQHYWADKNGNVSWIDPVGKPDQKKAKNRKIGYKIHGHTMFRKSPFETNFENYFDIDNKAHSIIKILKELTESHKTLYEFFKLLKLKLKKDRSINDVCRFHHLNEYIHRDLLLLILSLLIRSPANRNRYENYPKIMGLEPDDDIGKSNMAQRYTTARHLAEHGLLSNQFWTILYSPTKKFICGDGYLDWLTDSLNFNRIEGRVLVPLTPDLCVYFRTVSPMRSIHNCASLIAADWIVKRVNEIMQIYSRDKIFYLGSPPALSDNFQKYAFLAHKNNAEFLFETLDEIMPTSETP